MGSMIKEFLVAGALMLCSIFFMTQAFASNMPAASEAPEVVCKIDVVDGTAIAYREVGDPADPMVLFLQGLPASSYMFRNMIPELAERHYVQAPEYPGLGSSPIPSAEPHEHLCASNAGITGR